MVEVIVNVELTAVGVDVAVEVVVLGGLVLPGKGRSPQSTKSVKSQSMLTGSYMVPGPQHL